MKKYQLITLILTASITTNVFAAKPPPKPAKDLDCIECVDTVDIAPQAVTEDKLSQDVQDTLQNANLNDARITANSEDIQTNEINININASDISANATNIQANTTAISNIPAPRAISVLINGKRVGTFLQGNHLPQDWQTFLTFTSTFYTLLDSGYLTGVLADEDKTGLEAFRVYYQGNNCTGQAFLRSSQIRGLWATQGFVFYILDTPTIPDMYYVPKNTVFELTDTNSYYENGSCTDELIVNAGNFRAYINDSNATGVTKADFVGTVTLGY